MQDVVRHGHSIVLFVLLHDPTINRRMATKDRISHHFIAISETDRPTDRPTDRDYS